MGFFNKIKTIWDDKDTHKVHDVQEEQKESKPQAKESINIPAEQKEADDLDERLDEVLGSSRAEFLKKEAGDITPLDMAGYNKLEQLDGMMNGKSMDDCMKHLTPKGVGTVQRLREEVKELLGGHYWDELNVIQKAAALKDVYPDISRDITRDVTGLKQEHLGQLLKDAYRTLDKNLLSDDLYVDILRAYIREGMRMDTYPYNDQNRLNWLNSDLNPIVMWMLSEQNFPEYEPDDRVLFPTIAAMAYASLPAPLEDAVGKAIVDNLLLRNQYNDYDIEDNVAEFVRELSWRSPDKLQDFALELDHYSGASIENIKENLNVWEVEGNPKAVLYLPEASHEAWIKALESDGSLIEEAEYATAEMRDAAARSQDRDVPMCRDDIKPDWMPAYNKELGERFGSEFATEQLNHDWDAWHAEAKDLRHQADIDRCEAKLERSLERGSQEPAIQTKSLNDLMDRAEKRISDHHHESNEKTHDKDNNRDNGFIK